MIPFRSGKLPPRLWSLPKDEDGSISFIDTLVKESKLVCQGKLRQGSDPHVTKIRSIQGLMGTYTSL